jgi:hypothetical protein
MYNATQMTKKELQCTSKQYAHSKSDSVTAPMESSPRFLKNLLAKTHPSVEMIAPTTKKSIKTIYRINFNMETIPGEYATPHARALRVKNSDRSITKLGSSLAHLFLVCLW